MIVGGGCRLNILLYSALNSNVCIHTIANTQTTWTIFISCISNLLFAWMQVNYLMSAAYLSLVLLVADNFLIGIVLMAIGIVTSLKGFVIRHKGFRRMFYIGSQVKLRLADQEAFNAKHYQPPNIS